MGVARANEEVTDLEKQEVNSFVQNFAWYNFNHIHTKNKLCLKRKCVNECFVYLIIFLMINKINTVKLVVAFFCI